MTNRYLADFRNRFRFAIRYPRYAATSLVRDLTLSDERFLAQVSGASPREIRAYYAEPFEDREFFGHMESLRGELESTDCMGGAPYSKQIQMQYAILRAVRPEIVVETGVANGISSSYFLRALRENGTGHLHSIDHGGTEYLPEGRSTGWIVPGDLRDRWTLHLGDARVELPPLLEQLGEIDVFVHDSLHTYEHMTFEFRAAFPALRPGGVLLSDDASRHGAFPDFVVEVGSPLHETLRGVGILRKPPRPAT